MKPSAMLGHVWHAAHGWALALALALIVFVLSNPHLYPDPMLHVVHLFQYLYETMAAQQLELPQDARYGLSERLSYVLGASLLGSSPLPGSVPNLPMMLGTAVMALLATVGLGTLLARVARGPGAAGRLPAEGLLVVTLMVYVAGVSAGLGLAWQRYLVPTCLLAILLSALGLAVVARHLAGRANASRAGE
jgi:hypothetical protein